MPVHNNNRREGAHVSDRWQHVQVERACASRQDVGGEEDWLDSSPLQAVYEITTLQSASWIITGSHSSGIACARSTLRPAREPALVR